MGTSINRRGLPATSSFQSALCLFSRTKNKFGVKLQLRAYTRNAYLYGNENVNLKKILVLLRYVYTYLNNTCIIKMRIYVCGCFVFFTYVMEYLCHQYIT